MCAAAVCNLTVGESRALTDIRLVRGLSKSCSVNKHTGRYSNHLPHWWRRPYYNLCHLRDKKLEFVPLALCPNKQTNKKKSTFFIWLLQSFRFWMPRAKANSPVTLRPMLIKNKDRNSHHLNICSTKVFIQQRLNKQKDDSVTHRPDRRTPNAETQPGR